MHHEYGVSHEACWKLAGVLHWDMISHIKGWRNANIITAAQPMQTFRIFPQSKVMPAPICWEGTWCSQLMWAAKYGPSRVSPCSTASLARSKTTATITHATWHTTIMHMQQDTWHSKQMQHSFLQQWADSFALTWGTLSSRTYFSRTRGGPGASSSLTAASLKTCRVPSTSATFESYSIHCFASVLFLVWVPESPEHDQHIAQNTRDWVDSRTEYSWMRFSSV